MDISGVFDQAMAFELGMSEKQKTDMAEILARYDATDFGDQERRALEEELQAVGIPRTREGLRMMRGAGFKPGEEPADEKISAAGASSEKGSLWNAYRQFRSGEITEEDFLSLAQGQIGTGSLISILS